MRMFKIMLVNFILGCITLPLSAANLLTYYCSTDIEWCELMKREFEKTNWNSSQDDTKEFRGNPDPN